MLAQLERPCQRRVLKEHQTHDCVCASALSSFSHVAMATSSSCSELVQPARTSVFQKQIQNNVENCRKSTDQESARSRPPAHARTLAVRSSDRDCSKQLANKSSMGATILWCSSFNRDSCFRFRKFSINDTPKSATTKPFVANCFRA